jgi:polysaccharide transporter, PST family
MLYLHLGQKVKAFCFSISTFMAINYNRKLFSNFLSLSMVQAINFLIPLLVTPYVISKVGVDGIGAIAIAQTVMIYLSTITDYGFNLSATRDIALHKNDQQKLSRIFYTVLISKLMITVLLFVLMLILALFIPLLQQHFLLYLLGFTFVAGQVFYVNWFFVGVEKMHFITISSFVSRLIFLVLVFVFIKNKGDEPLFLLFMGVGNIIASVMIILVAIRLFKLRFFWPSFGDVLLEIKEGWQITLSILSLNTYLLSGIFILRMFTNDLMVGYYSIAVRIFFAARQVIMVFSEAVYPQVCQLTIKGKEAGRAFFKQVYFPFLMATFVGCILLFVFSPQIVYLFTKDGSTLPVYLLRMLSFVPLIVCINIPAYQLLMAFNFKKSYLQVFGFATVINIIVNVILAKEYGPTGTVLGIIGTELFITIGLNRGLYKNKLSGFLGPGII